MDHPGGSNSNQLVREPRAIRVPEPPSDPGTPSLLERALVDRTAHFTLATAFMLTMFMGLVPWVPGLVVLFALLFSCLVYICWVPSLHLRRGRFRRALRVAELIEAAPWISKQRPDWILLRAVCHLSLGEVEPAKKLLHSIDPRSLSGTVQTVHRLNLAVLYIRLMDLESARLLLEEADFSTLPAAPRSGAHLIRASLLSLQERFADAIAECERIEAMGPSAEIAAAAMALRALAIFELEGAGERALELSGRALAAMPPSGGGRHSLVLGHAFLVLEVSHDARACLDLVESVIESQHRFGLSGQALFHYLLARCYLESGLPGYAEEHRERAAALPATPRLAARIERLAARP